MVIFNAIIVINATFDAQIASVAVGSMAALCYFSALPFTMNLAKLQPKLNFQNRIREITNNYLNMTYEDDSLNKMNFNNCVKVTRGFQWYFLYTTKTIMFECIPLKIFNCEEDLNNFERLMKNTKLMA